VSLCVEYSLTAAGRLLWQFVSAPIRITHENYGHYRRRNMPLCRKNAVMKPGDSADKFCDLNFLNDASPFRRHATRYEC
jgi:hypothetical protein